MTLPREDDTPLDFIAAQARSFPPLEPAEVAELLETIRSGADDSARASERLLEHHLSVALDVAMAHADQGVEITDLYQEGTLAIIVAIAEYAAHSDPPTALRPYIERLVNRHVETAIAEAEAARAADLAMVRAAELFDIAQVRLRHELEREPTVAELAALLQWDESQVVTVAAMTSRAREQFDEEIIQYLDDEPGDEDGDV